MEGADGVRPLGVMISVDRCTQTLGAISVDRCTQTSRGDFGRQMHADL